MVIPSEIHLKALINHRKYLDIVMKIIRNTFLLIITGTGLVFLMVSSATAEQISDRFSIQTASAQSQPGNKEPEGLETVPPQYFSAGWDITLVSKYLFQGRDYSDGKPVIQPELTVTFKDFSAILWSNYDLHKKKADEFDLYLQYGREMEKLSVTTGYAHFNYPYRDGWAPSQEVFIELSSDVLLNLHVSVHYDFDAGKGSYSTLGMSHDLETSLGALSYNINLFYQDNYYELSGFPSIEFNVGLEHSIGPFSITPAISYFLTWDNGDFREDGPEGPVSDTWLFSINVAQSF